MTLGSQDTCRADEVELAVVPDLLLLLLLSIWAFWNRTSNRTSATPQTMRLNSTKGDRDRWERGAGCSFACTFTMANYYINEIEEMEMDEMEPNHAIPEL